MPTKHRRHAITETPRVREALDPLRAELNGDRLDLAELVVLGAEAKLAELRLAENDRDAKIRRLTQRIESQGVNVDPALALEAKRSWVSE